jgi:hypothetical protein
VSSEVYIGKMLGHLILRMFARETSVKVLRKERISALYSPRYLALFFYF